MKCAPKVFMSLIVPVAFVVLLGDQARADDASIEEQIIAVMGKLWGQHPATRANHAKGVVLEGAFTPSSAGQTLSTSPLFRQSSVPVVVRFSDSTGLPNIPDGSPGANPHGMAIKFRLSSGGEFDIVANSLPFFPVANGEDFRDLLQAVLDSPASSKKPTKADQFFASHPAAPAAFGAVRTPASFAREVYNGIDSFVFVSPSGDKSHFRFKIAPVGGTDYLSADEAAKLPPDALVDEIRKRVASNEIKFSLQAQLADSADAVNDATKPYPAERKVVDLGAIVLNKAVPEDKQLSYLPLNLPDGIEPSDDPLITIRNNAYAISFGRRIQ